jgi:hypothetical protein
LIGQLAIVSISRIHIYYTLLWQVFGFAVPFTTLSKLRKKNQFAEPNQYSKSQNMYW